MSYEIRSANRHIVRPSAGHVYGARYWARDVTAHIPKKVRNAMTEEQRELHDSMGAVGFAAVTPGCCVSLVECGDFDDKANWKKRSFTHVELARALEIIATKYHWHLRTIMNGGDADSGDLLVQLAALGGETVYG